MQTFWYRLTQVHLDELPLKHRDREEGGRERVTLSLVGSYRLTSGDQIQHGKTFGDGACRGSATQLYIAKMRARRLSSIAEFFFCLDLQCNYQFAGRYHGLGWNGLKNFSAWATSKCLAWRRVGVCCVNHLRTLQTSLSNMTSRALRNCINWWTGKCQVSTLTIGMIPAWSTSSYFRDACRCRVNVIPVMYIMYGSLWHYAFLSLSVSLSLSLSLHSYQLSNPLRIVTEE